MVAAPVAFVPKPRLIPFCVNAIPLSAKVILFGVPCHPMPALPPKAVKDAPELPTATEPKITALLEPKPISVLKFVAFVFVSHVAPRPRFVRVVAAESVVPKPMPN